MKKKPDKSAQDQTHVRFALTLSPAREHCKYQKFHRPLYVQSSAMIASPGCRSNDCSTALTPVVALLTKTSESAGQRSSCACGVKKKKKKKGSTAVKECERRSQQTKVGARLMIRSRSLRYVADEWLNGCPRHGPAVRSEPQIRVLLNAMQQGDVVAQDGTRDGAVAAVIAEQSVAAMSRKRTGTGRRAVRIVEVEKLAQLIAAEFECGEQLFVQLHRRQIRGGQIAGRK
jgi:hypothetical protein